MSKTLHYLYDPLCGWCYGATPAVAQVLEMSDLSVRLLPTGLFCGDRARPIDDEFARYAWSADQRIHRLTGQRFSERYREHVLGDRRARLDSGPSTIALTAVSMTDPSREFFALKAIQHARYVEGGDVTSPVTLVNLLTQLGLSRAAAMVGQPDEHLLSANHARLAQARALMLEFGAGGVPTFIAESGARRSILDSGDTYTNPRSLIRQLHSA